ncbi:MAG: SGNH/GDSL hydrolase family protein [Flavobacteriales bacterium]|nr:SGNH/GDSL hydrolase family protein [Flavobacteriales bacterium]
MNRKNVVRQPLFRLKIAASFFVITGVVIALYLVFRPQLLEYQCRMNSNATLPDTSLGRTSLILGDSHLANATIPEHVDRYTYSGATTAMLSEISNAYPTCVWDTMSVFLGTNDVFFHVDFEVSKERWQAFAKWATARKKPVHVRMINLPAYEPQAGYFTDPEEIAEAINEWNVFLASYCQQRGFEYADLNREMELIEGPFLTDGIHFTQSGQRVLGKLLFESREMP